MPTKSRKTKRTKKSTPIVQETAPVPEPVQETVSTSVPESVSVQETTTQPTSLEVLQGLIDEVDTLWKNSKSISTRLRQLKRQITKEQKRSQRGGKRRRTNTGPRAPSGFAKPTLISDELCNFLGVAPGSEMARTAVTKHLSQYIKEHSLQNPENKKQIVPDEALRNLLNVGIEDNLDYFNLQTYMKQHFIKSAPASS